VSLWTQASRSFTIEHPKNREIVTLHNVLTDRTLKPRRPGRHYETSNNEQLVSTLFPTRLRQHDDASELSAARFWSDISTSARSGCLYRVRSFRGASEFVVMSSQKKQDTTNSQIDQEPFTNKPKSKEGVSGHHPIGYSSTEPASATPYSVFNSSEKWAIVLLATFAGLFSPLGSSIYFPAIPSLVKAFHRSTQDIK
jgi:hypothetical protein